jgi:hypothetical protein
MTTAVLVWGSCDRQKETPVLGPHFSCTLCLSLYQSPTVLMSASSVATQQHQVTRSNAAVTTLSSVPRVRWGGRQIKAGCASGRVGTDSVQINSCREPGSALRPLIVLKDAGARAAAGAGTAAWLTGLIDWLTDWLDRSTDWLHWLTDWTGLLTGSIDWLIGLTLWLDGLLNRSTDWLYWTTDLIE